jgi:hypothetical protein
VAFISKNMPLCLRMPTEIHAVVKIGVAEIEPSPVVVGGVIRIDVIAILGLESTMAQAEVRTGTDIG